LTAIQTITQIPEDDIALITLCLTFGGSPGPFEWGVISETICDLANKLLQYKDWEPLTLHLSVEKEISTQQCLDNNIPFAVGRELIVDIPIGHLGYADVYIDDTMGLTVDLPGARNANKSRQQSCLQSRWQPNHKTKMNQSCVSQWWCGTANMKMILGWHFHCPKHLP
jgi:hypothetical protein